MYTCLYLPHTLTTLLPTTLSPCFFCSKEPAPTYIYTLSLHDALPILDVPRPARHRLSILRLARSLKFGAGLFAARIQAADSLSPMAGRPKPRAGKSPPGASKTYARDKNAFLSCAKRSSRSSPASARHSCRLPAISENPARESTRLNSSHVAISYAVCC